MGNPDIGYIALAIFLIMPLAAVIYFIRQRRRGSMPNPRNRRWLLFVLLLIVLEAIYRYLSSVFAKF